MKKRLEIDRSAQCVGCRQCELVCSLLHEDIFAPWLSRVTVIKEEATADSHAIICRQCKNAKCAKACPNLAIVMGPDGVLVVDSSRCNGCMECVKACPFDAMRFNHSKRLAMKCDLCGGDIQCATVCPAHVLVAEGEQ